MKTARFQRYAITITLLTLATPLCHAQLSVWTGPANGFYETSGNWTPSGTPTAEATFWRPGDFNVLFSGNESVQKLSLSNNTDVTFTPGNLNPTRRTYIVEGEAVIDNASLTLGGAGVATDLAAFSVATWNEGNINVTNGSRWEAHSTVIYDGSSLDVSGANSAGTASSGSTDNLFLKNGGTINLSEGAQLTYGSLQADSAGTVNVVGADTLGNSTAVKNLGEWAFHESYVSATEINIMEGAQFEANRINFGEDSQVDIIGMSDSGVPSRFTSKEMSARHVNLRVAEGAELVTTLAWVGTSFENGRVTIGSASGMPASWIAYGDVVVQKLGDVFLRENTYASFAGLGIRAGGRVKVFENATLHVDRMVVEDEFLLANASTDERAGTLEVGTLEGDLSNANGVVAPGPDAGLTSIAGKYTQHPDAKLSIEIGGSNGSEFDIVSVGGHASLRGGDLELSLLDGFRPNDTDTFHVVQASIITGVFDNVGHGERLTTADGNGSFVVNYGAASPFDIDHVVLSDFMWLAGLTGDFNGDGLLDAADIDLLSTAMGGTDTSFDLTSDGLIDNLDREHWVGDLKMTHFGDADMNGAVEFADFLALASGFGSEAGWSDGDFDGSGDVAFADFLMLANNFGQTSSVSSSAAAVPEPAAGLMAAFGVLGLLGLRRRSL